MKKTHLGILAAVGLSLGFGYQNIVDKSGPIPIKLIQTEGTVPILMYHNIDDKDDRFSVSPQTFREHLEFLHDHDFKLITPDDFFSGYYQSQSDGKKPVLLTFDDCSEGQFRIENDLTDPNSAVGILEDFTKQNPDFGKGAIFFCDSMKETSTGQFVYSVPFDQSNSSTEKLDFLLEHYTLGNHTLTHSYIDNSTKKEVETEIKSLDQILGVKTTYFAYPFGHLPQSTEVQAYLKETMVGSFSCNNDLSLSPDDPKFDSLHIPRIEMNEHSQYKLDLINWRLEHLSVSQQTLPSLISVASARNESPLQKSTSQMPVQETNPKNRLIILDPGHGGIDTGAVVEGMYEDEIAYDITVRLRELLLHDGYSVHQTVYDSRTKYTPVDKLVANKSEYLVDAHGKKIKLTSRYLGKRTVIIDSFYDPDQDNLLVSVHINSVFNPLISPVNFDPILNPLFTSVQGARVYYPSEKMYGSKPAEEKSRQFAQTVKASFEKYLVPTYSIDFLGLELGFMKDTLDFDRFHLAIFGTKLEDKILIECANLQNQNDRKKLADPNERQRLALAIYDGIVHYINQP